MGQDEAGEGRVPVPLCGGRRLYSCLVPTYYYASAAALVVNDVGNTVILERAHVGAGATRVVELHVG
jgi:hypothetical protein